MEQHRHLRRPFCARWGEVQAAGRGAGPRLGSAGRGLIEWVSDRKGLSDLQLHPCVANPTHFWLCRVWRGCLGPATS